jgi:hypothetical protein
MYLVNVVSGIHSQSGSYSKRRRCSRAGSLVPYTRRVGLSTLLEGFSIVNLLISNTFWIIMENISTRSYEKLTLVHFNLSTCYMFQFLMFLNFIELL